MRFAQSAFKHGISEARIRHVVDHCGRIFEADAPADSPFPGSRLLFLGDDQRGVALEVVAVEVEVGGNREDLLVIHAMPLRARYREQYLEALPCRI